MTIFSRGFAVEAVADADQSPFLKRLFDEWQLPGVDAQSTLLGLRVAVRSGYLNFYGKGQSVARMSIVRGSPRIDVHEAYLGECQVTGYRSFGMNTLALLPPEELDHWWSRALGRAGEEKRFVDDLVATNAGTLDLEMGLPGDERAMTNDKRVAPRMDIVVAQDGPNGEPQLAFWEAKCADNGELRARPPRAPHVVNQLQNYISWLALGEDGYGAKRSDEVLKAYSAAASVLVQLATYAGKRECEALSIWRRVATVSLTAIRQPGVVVGNYRPARSDNGGETERNVLLRKHAESFASKMHRSRLEQMALDGPIRVIEFDERPVTPLPRLSGRVIARSTD